MKGGKLRGERRKGCGIGLRKKEDVERIELCD
jgi:hypothetical protein